MSNICDVDRILKTECNLQHYTRSCRIKNLDDFERDEAEAQLWRAGLLNMKEKGITICLLKSNISEAYKVLGDWKIQGMIVW